MRNYFPKSESPARPYHLWDAVNKKPLRWRYYSDHKRAHMGALIEARWGKLWHPIEVYNAQNGRLLGQYVRGVNTVFFSDGRMDLAALKKSSTEMLPGTPKVLSTEAVGANSIH